MWSSKAQELLKLHKKVAPSKEGATLFLCIKTKKRHIHPGRWTLNWSCEKRHKLTKRDFCAKISRTKMEAYVLHTLLVCKKAFECLINRATNKEEKADE